MADAREKKARLNEIFEHCKREVLGGTFNCAVHEATRLGAYIMQVDLGDYDAAAARILSLDDLVSYLPKNYCDCKTSEKETRKALLLAEWESLAGTKKPQAKFRFAKICRGSPTFGATFWPCRFGGKKSKKGLVGFSSKQLLVIDVVTKEVIENHPLDKVSKWQVTKEGMVISFREYDYAQLAVKLEPGSSGQVSAAITSAVKRVLKKKKLENRKSQGSLLDTQSIGSEMGMSGSSTDYDGQDDGPISPPQSPGLGSLSKQSGFLMGFNRSTQVFGASSWGVDLDVNKGALAQPAPSSESPGTIAEVEDEFSQFLDDASEDIMASAATLDSVARLGPNRANPKWCAKAGTQGKGKVKQLVLGISVKCKQLIPIAMDTAQSNRDTASQKKARDLATATVKLFLSTLPPLAGQIVRLAALSTLRGRGEELLDAAGDMWIGILQFVQAMRHTSEEDVQEAAPLIAGGAQTLLKLLPVLTPEDEAQRTAKQVQADADALTAEAKVNQAIKEVERLAEEETARKRKDSIKRKADMKKAVSEAEKEAAKQLAREEKRAKEEAAKRKAQEELAKKKKDKEEAARRKREAEEAERAKRRAGFKSNIDKWETLTRGDEDTVTV
eukprot:m.166975 g.166975  ORF g.166975 m.166975 type:complete len:614 (+) comp14718_c0_seq2:47-1888(+)